MSETITIASVVEQPVETIVAVRIRPDFRPLQEVKAGTGAARAWTIAPVSAGIGVTADAASLTFSSAEGRWRATDGGIEVSWRLRVEPGSAVTVGWDVALHDPTLVVQAAAPTARKADAVDRGAEIADVESAHPRLARWLHTALGDLDALRLALPDHPDDVFLAAGAPWFLTLFGRDSLWAARMMLPVDAGLAASTLRVLARLQGTRDDPQTEEEPGKIAHELRAAELSMPGEGILLPPLYFGTVDATALWVCLLVDAADGGMPLDEVRALVPALRGALGWIQRAAGERGFLSYVDRTGRGLANQGWKDSGDSIQWRDGTLAAGPIALCEVQGYAYEAAIRAGGLLDRLQLDGSDALRVWAADLRSRFAERFWVTTPEGRYPAIALDRDGRPVDTLTSNIGHLLGTGILEPADEAGIADLLVGETMSSGFGVRTLSTDAGGYWPLGYHRGTVWPHDSAIIAHGMARAGLRTHARQIVDGLLAAADAFGFRMPELYGGDARGERARPAPYPAACRPQGWSAAAAVTCREILLG